MYYAYTNSPIIANYWQGLPILSLSHNAKFPVFVPHNIVYRQEFAGYSTTFSFFFALGGLFPLTFHTETSIISSLS